MPLHKGNLSALKFFTAENAGSYDRLVYAATFGQDKVWKKQIAYNLKNSKIILDLGCGTGILSTAIQKVNNFGVVYGLDLNFKYLQVALAKKIDLPLLNSNAEVLPFKDEAFDSVVASYVPKYTHIDKMLNECLRVLKQNGILVLHDFTYPTAGLMRVIWKSYFLILKLISNIIRSWKDVFMELDYLIEESKWLIECMNILNAKGMRLVTCTYYTLGTAAIVVAQKK
jgi:demethylmenaquinone methyltransferase / 2-methoxy-6-polyprenyl-1,4-benzoquinol methylase